MHAQLKQTHKDKTSAQAQQIEVLAKELKKEQERLRKVNEAIAAGTIAGAPKQATSSSSSKKIAQAKKAKEAEMAIQQKLAAAASEQATTAKALSDELAVQREQVEALAAGLAAEKEAVARMVAARDAQTAAAAVAVVQMQATTLRAAKLEAELQEAAGRHAAEMVRRDLTLAATQTRLESAAAELGEAQRRAAALGDAHTEQARQAAAATAALEAAAHRAGQLEVLLARVSTNGEEEWAVIRRLTAELESANGAVRLLTNDVVVAKSKAASTAVQAESAEAALPNIEHRLAAAAEEHAAITQKLTASIASQQQRVEALAAKLAAEQDSVTLIAAARDAQTAAAASAALKLEGVTLRAAELEAALQAAAERHAAEMVEHNCTLADKQAKLEALAMELGSVQQEQAAAAAAASSANGDRVLDLSNIAAILSSPPRSLSWRRGEGGTAGDAAGDAAGAAVDGASTPASNSSVLNSSSSSSSDRNLSAWLDNALHEHQEEAAVIESAQTTVKHAQHNFETLLEGLLADEASQSINPPGASSRDGTFEDEEEEETVGGVSLDLDK